jgi:hypothetical protein
VAAKAHKQRPKALSQMIQISRQVLKPCNGELAREGKDTLEQFYGINDIKRISAKLKAQKFFMQLVI